MLIGAPENKLFGGLTAKMFADCLPYYIWVTKDIFMKLKPEVRYES